MTFTACTYRKPNDIPDSKTINKTVKVFPDLAIRNASFPLSLSRIDFHETENVGQFNEEIQQQIRKTISDIYYTDCQGDSNQTYFSIDDTYIGTVRLRDSLQSIFLVIFQHIPGGPDSKILFYDMHSGKFADSIIRFSIHGLYDFDGVHLRPTRLKEQFKIQEPEIELVDFDKNGINDFKFTRLHHNGTANAIETMIIKAADLKIDTLDFKQIWIGQEIQLH